MSDRDGLLAAVIADPDADAPRLVFADWLDEHGDPDRAEFIRLQCRIAAIERTCMCGGCVRKRGGGQHHNGPCGADQQRVTIDAEGRTRAAHLRRREHELLSAHKNDWLPEPVAEAVVFGGATPDEAAAGLVWRRGFVEEAAMPVGDFRSYGEAVMDATPLRVLTLADYDPGRDTVFETHGLLFRRLRTLRIPAGARRRVAPFLVEAVGPCVVEELPPAVVAGTRLAQDAMGRVVPAEPDGPSFGRALGRPDAGGYVRVLADNGDQVVVQLPAADRDVPGAASGDSFGGER